MDMSDMDMWNRGTLHKPSIWIFYVVSNYVGVVLCAILMSSVYHNPRRNATDIFVAGLCSGCLWMSLTCGTQCLLSVIAGRFYGGELACQVEAIAHVSSILTEFFCVALIAVRSYLLVVRKLDIPQRTAFIIIIVVWCVCCLVTGLASLFSPIYLMSAGTYCFFGFSSFAIAGWLLPGLVLALGIMSACYYRIWRVFKMTSEAREIFEAADYVQKLSRDGGSQTNVAVNPERASNSSGARKTTLMGFTLDVLSPKSPQPPTPTRASPSGSTVGTHHSTSPSMGGVTDVMFATADLPKRRTVDIGIRKDLSPRQVALRSAWFILILLLGWGFAAITAIYELAVGEALEWLVTAVGVGGVSFSWWMPLTYAYTSEFQKRTMTKLFGWMCVPCFGMKWWQASWSNRPRSNPGMSKDKTKVDTRETSKVGRGSVSTEETVRSHSPASSGEYVGTYRVHSPPSGSSSTASMEGHHGTLKAFGRSRSSTHEHTIARLAQGQHVELVILVPSSSSASLEPLPSVSVDNLAAPSLEPRDPSPAEDTLCCPEASMNQREESMMSEGEGLSQAPSRVPTPTLPA